jgi:Ca2+-transporting ATPase
LNNIDTGESSSFLESINKKTGLTREQVSESREKFGTNALTPPPRPPLWLLFLEKFKDPTIILLSGAAAVSLLIGIFKGTFHESIGIFIAILLATGMAFYSEYKSGKEFELLNDIKDERAKVRRYGKFHTIPVQELVVGDIAFIEMGDRIPADGIVIKTAGLLADESLLTGESVAVNKTVQPPQDDSESHFKKNRVYMGTLISDGSGIFQVTQVGDNTEMGRIAASLSESEQPPTPLQERLGVLSKQIGYVGMTMAVLIFVSLVILNYSIGKLRTWNMDTFDMVVNFFVVAVAVVVVAVPEGLPMMVTMSLALNMRKMAAANCLVKKLEASETIGSVTVICSDKTGTLTQNKMKPVWFYVGGQELDRESVPGVFETPEWQSMVKNAAINSNANLEMNNGSCRPVGNATEGALLCFLHEQGVIYSDLRDGAEVVRQIPFSSARKKMVTVIQEGEGFLCLEKGAPSILLEECTHVMMGGEKKEIGPYRAQIEAALDGASSNAYRVLAFTLKETPHACSDGFQCGGCSHHHVLMGMVGIADPLRDEVYESVEACHRAGIDVKMITGDDIKTARSIARQCRILRTEDDLALTQGEFDALSDEELSQKIDMIKVLARSRPADKLRLVKALHARRAVVGMTGDGTNDAPALRQADVGISMGKAGTQVANEASDIVLLDDNFSSIVSGILWGRTIYENIQRLIQFQLTVNVVALLVAFIGPFIGTHMLPLTVVQLLWVNIIMDTFAALALSTEPPRDETLLRCPRKRDELIITPSMACYIGITGIFMTIVLLVLLNTGFLGGAPGIEQLTILFTTFVMFQFWNEFNCRSLSHRQSPFQNLSKNPMFIAIVSIIFIIQVLVVNFGGPLFRTVPIPLETWAKIILITLSVLPVGYGAKLAAHILFKEEEKVCPLN